MKTCLRLTLILISLVLTGCETFRATEVQRSLNLPFLSDEIHIIGITAETDANGNEVLRAEAVIHSTNVLGYGRTATYRDVEIKRR